ncbi:MAG: enoyl-CoA hydratase/isomerase family protein [Acidimicrobiales bacterium]
MTSTSAFSTLSVELEPGTGVAVLTLNRPDQGNAINGAMAAELRQAALELSYDRSVRAVVLQSFGRVFCGGGDLASFANSSDDELPRIIDSLTIDLHAAVARFAKMDAPVVAAVTGAAGGAGMSLVAACDLVIAGESARFTMGYTKAGLVPDGTSSFFLARVVGLRRATELVLTNRVLSAAEAAEWGLINRVVPDEDVRAEALTLARSLATGATRSLGLAKRVLIEGASSALEEAMERESRYVSASAATGDAREGIAAFLAKRSARFEGR